MVMNGGELPSLEMRRRVEGKVKREQLRDKDRTCTLRNAR